MHTLQITPTYGRPPSSRDYEAQLADARDAATYWMSYSARITLMLRELDEMYPDSVVKRRWPDLLPMKERVRAIAHGEEATTGLAMLRRIVMQQIATKWEASSIMVRTRQDVTGWLRRQMGALTS